MEVKKKSRIPSDIDYKKASKVVNQKKAKKVCFLLPEEDYKKFKARTVQDGISITSLMGGWIKTYADRPLKE
jgi:hypothetical protein